MSGHASASGSGSAASGLHELSYRIGEQRDVDQAPYREDVAGRRHQRGVERGNLAGAAPEERQADGGDLGARPAGAARAGIHRHRRVHQAWQDHVGAHAVGGVLQRELPGERDHRRLARLVGDQRVVLERGERGDQDDRSRALRAHQRHDVLAGHHCAAQVDRHHAIKGFLGDLGERLVAPRDAHPDVVVQDVDPAPALARGAYHGGQRGLARHVGFEGAAVAARLARQRHRLLGRSKVAIRCHHSCAFAGKAQHRGTAVAHALALALAGADHDRDLVLQAHAPHPEAR